MEPVVRGAIVHVRMVCVRWGKKWAFCGAWLKFATSCAMWHRFQSATPACILTFLAALGRGGTVSLLEEGDCPPLVPALLSLGRAERRLDGLIVAGVRADRGGTSARSEGWRDPVRSHAVGPTQARCPDRVLRICSIGSDVRLNTGGPGNGLWHGCIGVLQDSSTPIMSSDLRARLVVAFGGMATRY
jgi:hypothetical protein